MKLSLDVLIMKLDVYNLKNEKVGKIDVASEIFAAPIKEHLHQNGPLVSNDTKGPFWCWNQIVVIF